MSLFVFKVFLGHYIIALGLKKLKQDNKLFIGGRERERERERERKRENVVQ